jgi:hypothetical protein
MARTIRVADCVRLPDGRIGRVRAIQRDTIRVRVRRKTSATHQLVMVRPARVRQVPCPAGWMSPQGYARYLRVTLDKMRRRRKRSGATARGRRAGRPGPR